MWAITLGFGLLTVGIFWLGMAASLPEAATATLIRTLGGGILWVFSSALLQILVEDRFRGRVFAFEFAAFTLTQSFSTLWAGIAQDQLAMPVQQVLRDTSLAGLVVSLLWLAFQVGILYRRRTYPL